jgi:hypothetical protein
MFLSKEMSESLTLDELLDVEQLKELLVQQVKLLDRGLHVHKRHMNESSKLLHASLVESFNEYHKTIEQLCGLNFETAWIHRKESTILRRKSTRSSDVFSELATDVILPLPPRRSNRHSSKLLK